MTTDSARHWDLVKEIFTAAAEAEDGAAVVAQLAGDDPELSAEVHGLLALHRAPELTLDAPAALPLNRRRPGELLAGRYRVSCFLASGGMGDVYSGVDEETGAKVALKLIGMLASGHARAEARFRREVELAKQIEHPNVCRMDGLAEQDGQRFCVMELLDGETLAQRLERQGRFSAEEALPIALQLCAGLEAAHAAGVVHRDLKPGNIFLEADRAVIIDFGLAAAAVRDASLTSPSAVIGTLAYMAPEQMEGDPATVQSDLYALGVVLYEMLTGHKPHQARSPFRLAAQKSRGTYGGARLDAPDLPSVWDEVLARCLKACPAERFSSADEVKLALLRGRCSWRFTLRRPRVVLPLAAAALALALWTGWARAQEDYRPDPQAAELYAEAIDAMTQSASVRGAELLERAVQMDPAFVKAFALLATARAETDQIAGAREAVLQATAAADRRWLLGRGERAALDAVRATVIRDFLSAAELYSRLAAVTSGPDRVQALLALGLTLDQAGKTDDAIEIFETALREDPTSSPVRVRLATLLARRRDYEAAAREFAEAERDYRQSGNSEGLVDLLLARSLAIRTRDRADEQRDLDEALALSAETGNRYHHLSAQFKLANLAVEQREYQRAADITRAAAAQAQKDGLPTVAAQAQSELGYLFIYQKEPEKAVPILREAMAMAERSGGLATLAATRMRLGEALEVLQQRDEAVELMQPAIEWYRQGGYDDILPLMLIKLGTAIPPGRAQERIAAFEEAFARAEENGDEMFESMALQRLASDAEQSDLAMAATYYERALPLARKVGNHNIVFAAGRFWTNGGEYEKGEALLSEFERTVRTFPAGPGREGFLGVLHASRADGLFRRGLCAGALAELERSSKPTDLGTIVRRRIETCLGLASQTHLAWARMLRSGTAHEWIAAADIALRAGDRTTAARCARAAMARAGESMLRPLQLEAALLLRAAERDDSLSPECLELARTLGFDPPEQLGGRPDLLRLWRSLGSTSGRPGYGQQ